MGGDPDALARPLRRAGEIAAYLEMHIEQGPVLESRGVPIGIVTGIASMAWHRIVVEGRAGHAGTTPMDLRQDALAGAAEIVLAVERMGRELAARGPFVATAGRLRNKPNNMNVVPARTELTVDLRSHDEALLDHGWQRILDAVEAICQARRLRCSTRCLGRAPGVQADPMVMEALERAAHELGYATLRLSSGAGHDAMHVARIAPMGMLFIPCRAGLSHCPEEWAEPRDIARGAEVLARALQWLDRRLP